MTDATAPSPPRLQHRRGAPRWLVTFADLMALLFALFVLLLSFSDINSDKFRRNAGPISEAFNVKSIIQRIPLQPKVLRLRPREIPRDSQRDAYVRDVKRARLVGDLKRSMRAEIGQGLVELDVRENSVIIRFPDKSAFSLGSVDLAARILPTLDKIAQVIAAADGAIRVAGHTDNRPISTSKFRSNWDLSAARATSVVHYLLRDQRIRRDRVVVQGFADTRPRAGNDTAANRARNRRVEISIEVTAKR